MCVSAFYVDKWLVISWSVRFFIYPIGNDNIHHISTHGHHELSIYMEIASGEHRTANYSTFAVGDEDSKYILTVTGYSGNAGGIIIYAWYSDCVI